MTDKNLTDVTDNNVGKMSDNEIKKALECCVSEQYTCGDCPAFVTVDRSNCKKYFRGAIDLINRLQAENERLSKITRPLIAEIKAEAYTEFAERIKEKAMQKFDWNEYVEVEDIDNLVKEMVGGNE